MKHVTVTATGLAAALLCAGSAWAAEKTVTLAVSNMTCASCPYIVKRTLAGVPGVSGVKVSFENRTAVVTFDDTRATVAALTKATAGMGYPSRPIRQGG